MGILYVHGLAYGAFCICHGSSLWHNLVVYVTENDYSQTFNLHNIMETKSSLGALRNYVKPSMEVICVEVEGGFSLSNNQEPSPWEDM